MQDDPLIESTRRFDIR